MGDLFTALAAILLAWAVYRTVLHIRKERYFASDEFATQRARSASVVAEHNDINRYATEMHARGTFQLGRSTSGRQAHLASSHNTSQWNYRRDRHLANYHARNVHNCSLQVVRNAQADPLKYLMKYFSITADESTLASVERLGENIARLETAISNLRSRETSIVTGIDAPQFIRRHFEKELMEQVGVELSPISVPYPVYVFEYVSAGGNSSQRTSVTLRSQTIDALIQTLDQKIRWTKSAAGQRALMTTSLRRAIKKRDNHACRLCSISVADEPHLLLEVDHIIPVSRGGRSVPENLQTLCWRCNRSKSDKMPGQ